MNVVIVGILKISELVNIRDQVIQNTRYVMLRFKAERGDRFLICSDGLIDGLWDRQLEETVRTPPAGVDTRSPAHRLVEEAVANSGRDNTTAVVVELGAPSATT